MITTVDKNEDGKISYSEFRVSKLYQNQAVFFVEQQDRSIFLCGLFSD